MQEARLPKDYKYIYYKKEIVFSTTDSFVILEATVCCKDFHEMNQLTEPTVHREINDNSSSEYSKPLLSRLKVQLRKVGTKYNNFRSGNCVFRLEQFNCS